MPESRSGEGVVLTGAELAQWRNHRIEHAQIVAVLKSRLVDGETKLESIGKLLKRRVPSCEQDCPIFEDAPRCQFCGEHIPTLAESHPERYEARRLPASMRKPQ